MSVLLDLIVHNFEDIDLSKVPTIDRIEIETLVQNERRKKTELDFYSYAVASGQYESDPQAWQKSSL